MRRLRIDDPVRHSQAVMLACFFQYVNSLVIGHRRLGKTHICLYFALVYFMTNFHFEYPMVDFIGVEEKQQKKAVWPTLVRFLKHFPESLIEKNSEREGVLRLRRPKWNDILQIYVGGQSNPGGAVGAYTDLLIADEAAFWVDGVLEKIFIPRTADEHRGQSRIIQIGAVNGMGPFYKETLKFMDLMRKYPTDYKVLDIKATHSGALSKEHLEKMRIRIGDKAFASQFLNDFRAEVTGGVLKAQIDTMRKQQRWVDITKVSYKLKYYIAVDIGVGENLAVWILALNPADPSKVIVLKYFKTEEDDTMSKILPKALNYRLDERTVPITGIIVPHDSSKRDGYDGKQFETQLRRDLPKEVSLIKVPKPSKWIKRIEVLRNVFHTFHFDRMGTIEGFTKLQGWEFNKTKDGFYEEKAAKNGNDHAGDALSHFAMFLDKRYGKKISQGEKGEISPIITDLGQDTTEYFKNLYNRRDRGIIS